MCLRSILSALKELRAEIHGRVDDVFVDKLDEVIRLVELTGGKPDHLAKVERLQLLAKALEVLPSLIYLIERLFR